MRSVTPRAIRPAQHLLGGVAAEIDPPSVQRHVLCAADLIASPSTGTRSRQRRQTVGAKPSARRRGPIRVEAVHQAIERPRRSGERMSRYAVTLRPDILDQTRSQACRNPRDRSRCLPGRFPASGGRSSSAKIRRGIAGFGRAILKLSLSLVSVSGPAGSRAPRTPGAACP